jgi:predicted HicB family RNase H-like nuclease
VGLPAELKAAAQRCARESGVTLTTWIHTQLRQAVHRHDKGVA